jgi:hypothetical protein
MSPPSSWSKNKPTKNNHESRWFAEVYLSPAGFLLGVFFDAEDGGYMFLRNVCWLSTDYTALYPRS